MWYITAKGNDNFMLPLVLSLTCLEEGWGSGAAKNEVVREPYRRAPSAMWFLTHIYVTRKSHENAPDANMADHSVSARDELHESEVSQSLMFCFDNASPENSYFVVDLFCLISLCLRVAVFLNATRRNRNLPPFTLKGKM